MKNALQYLPLLFLFLFSCKDDDAQPELPPATQTGERTFGAYVNGEVWVPKGRPSTFRSNLNIVYDPGYKGGTIDIRAYRINEDQEYIQIGSSGIGMEGSFKLENKDIYLLGYEDSRCDLNSSDEEVFSDGVLEITRLDMQEGIVSGTFEFTLAKEGCDTIRVTDGRFDYQL